LKGRNKVSPETLKFIKKTEGEGSVGVGGWQLIASINNALNHNSLWLGTEWWALMLSERKGLAGNPHIHPFLISTDLQ